MLLDRLQFGFLLFETEQGLVRVDLSRRERIFLLWAFRNFRQLSMPLLNSRQRELVNTLFRNGGVVVSPSHDPSLAIGVIENFVPPAVPTGVSPIRKPAEKKEPQERVETPLAELAPKPKPASASSPTVAWFKPATSKPAPFKPATFKPATFKPATALGALFLCVISVAAWHRMQGIPDSQAHNQPRVEQIAAIALPDPANFVKPAATAEIRTDIAATAVTEQSVAAPEADIAPARLQTAEVIPDPIPTPKRALRARNAPLTPNLSLSAQDSSIQASRAPLRFGYPAYPEVRARGVVALTARVDSDGTVGSVRVVSGNRALAAAAVRAVRQWRYRPYLKDGQPVATETNIVITFIADDAISMSFPPSIPATR